jgi:hypothetical protein
LRNVGAGAEDRADPSFLQEIVILGRDHAADDNKDVARPGIDRVILSPPIGVEGAREVIRTFRR